jgi:pimeloyl-ACP methyl ester carboxylesterase
MAWRPDRTRVLPRLDVPVLILVGEDDELTPPEESRAMEREVRGSELETIPEAGHLASLEQPEPFNQALEGFLRRLRI